MSQVPEFLDETRSLVGGSDIAWSLGSRYLGRMLFYTVEILHQDDATCHMCLSAVTVCEVLFSETLGRYSGH